MNRQDKELWLIDKLDKLEHSKFLLPSNVDTIRVGYTEIKGENVEIVIDLFDDTLNFENVKQYDAVGTYMSEIKQLIEIAEQLKELQ